MTKRLRITYDQALIGEIAMAFNLRAHNKAALEQLAFEFSREYDRTKQKTCHMATGAGKTYLMAAFVEYLRRQGVYNVMIVTPGITVQTKTKANFSPGHKKFVSGALVPPVVYSPGDIKSTLFGRVSDGEEASTLYVFNIQQLIAPKSLEGETKSGGARATARGLRRDNEAYGNVFAQLQDLDDLVVIADESHLYSDKAKAFSSALAELDPAARVGLTASALPEDEVVYKYPLYKAIADKCVKTPVLAFREGGYPEDSEDLQLKDALRLLRIKATHYEKWAKENSKKVVHPVLMVTCTDTMHATAVAEKLSGKDFLGSQEAVLQVDSSSMSDTVRERLDSVDNEDSPVRAVVSVAMLKEGWDVKNVAVLLSLRASTSDILTEQTMGRGLRLPYGEYTGESHVDELDIISHEQYRKMLKSSEVLNTFGLDNAVAPGKTPEENTSGDQSDTPPQVGIKKLDDALDEEEAVEPVVIDRTAAGTGVNFLFPSTVNDQEYKQPSLSLLKTGMIVEAASSVGNVSTNILREGMGSEDGKSFSMSSNEDAEAESILVDVETVSSKLCRAAMLNRMLKGTKENKKAIKERIVPTFIKSVNHEWTEKSLDSAVGEISSLIQRFLLESSDAAITEVTISPVRIPSSDSIPLPDGVNIAPRVNKQSEFSKKAFYKGWKKSVFNAVSFDAYSTEFRIAELADRSTSVDWWYRLDQSDGAQIAYAMTSNYHPDFVVYDSKEEIFWIVEGKAENKRGDAEVIAKRDAVESLINEIVVSDDITDQWGYLLAYESDLNVATSWDDLKARADVIRP